MNLDDWNNISRGLQGDVDRKQCAGENKDNAARNNFEKDPCSGYIRSTIEEQQHTSTNVGWDHHRMSTYSGYITKTSNIASTSEGDTDLNGEALEMSEADLELARKKKMLQEIEEQIMLKKAAIALKKLEPFLNSNTLFSVLKEPITKDYSKLDMSLQNELVLQEAGNPETKLPPAYDCRPAYNGSSLKERVNAILHKRPPCRVPSKAPKVEYHFGEKKLSGVKKDNVRPADHPLKCRVKSLMRKKHCSLNGEDPDVEQGTSSQTCTLPMLDQNSVSEGFQRFLSVLNKGVDLNLLSKIVTDNTENVLADGELLDVLPSELHSGALPQDHSRSRSHESRAEPLSRKGSHSTEGQALPGEASCDQASDGGGDGHFSPSVTPGFPQEVEEKTRKVDEQQGQLQHILKTLGLSLEEEELSKLTDRTQERLYGKKDDKQRADKTQEPDVQKSSSMPRDDSCASDFRDSQTQEKSHEESQDGDMAEMDYQGSYPSYSSYSSSPAYPCPEFTSSNTAYHGGTYNNPDPTWDVPCAPDNANYPYQDPSHAFLGTAASLDVSYPHPELFLNPDLSASEGQNGLQCGSRCLQPIRTQHNKIKACSSAFTLFHKQRHQLKRLKRQEDIEKNRLYLKSVEMESEEYFKQLTENDLKSNLKKKLDEFNQKMKMKVVHKGEASS